MLYLICSKRGFYVGLSREATEHYCGILRAQMSNVICCSSYEDAVLCVDTYRNSEWLPAEVMVDKLTFWTPVCIKVLVDLHNKTSFRCSNTGSVQVTLPDGQVSSYSNDWSEAFENKKTKRLLKKLGELYFYDFHARLVKKITADGELYQEVEESMMWKKCPTKINCQALK